MKLRYRPIGAVAALGILAACTASQIQTAGDLACTEAKLASSIAQSTLKGGALVTAQSIDGYIMSVCASEATLTAAIAADPSTVQWLGGLLQQVKDLINPPAAT